jgi:hypothetical protein
VGTIGFLTNPTSALRGWISTSVSLAGDTYRREPGYLPDTTISNRSRPTSAGRGSFVERV